MKYVLIAFLLVGCGWKQPDLERVSNCKKQDPVNKECVDWDYTFYCKMKMPIFFYDSTLAICKEESDCRAVCDKLAMQK